MLEQAVRLDSIASGTGQELGCTRLSGSILINALLVIQGLPSPNGSLSYCRQSVRNRPRNVAGDEQQFVALESRIAQKQGRPKSEQPIVWVNAFQMTTNYRDGLRKCGWIGVRSRPKDEQ